jgi:nitrogen regulatory protein PII
MTKLEAIIQPSRFEAVKEALTDNIPAYRHRSR